MLKKWNHGGTQITAKYSWSFLEYCRWFIKNGLPSYYDLDDCVQQAMLNILQEPKQRKSRKEDHGSPRQTLFKYLKTNKMPPKGSPDIMYLRSYLYWQRRNFMQSIRRQVTGHRDHYWQQSQYDFNQIPTYDEKDL